jgi:hypothetical protein
MRRRGLNELVNREEPAWPLVQEWLQDANHPVEVLPASDPARGEALVATQVTTRSPMGAVLYESGGMLMDHGWVRVLGSGHPRLTRSLPGWNAERQRLPDGTAPPFLLIGDDVVGGFFAVNGGGLGDDPGQVYYFAPDQMQWEGLDLSYSDWLVWCLQGDLAGFYQDYRWDGWQTGVAALSGDQAFLLNPFPFCSGPALSERQRGVVPVAELYGLFVEGTADR